MMSAGIFKSPVCIARRTALFAVLKREEKEKGFTASPLRCLVTIHSGGMPQLRSGTESLASRDDHLTSLDL